MALEFPALKCLGLRNCHAVETVICPQGGPRSLSKLVASKANLLKRFVKPAISQLWVPTHRFMFAPCSPHVRPMFARRHYRLNAFGLFWPGARGLKCHSQNHAGARVEGMPMAATRIHGLACLRTYVRGTYVRNVRGHVRHVRNVRHVRVQQYCTPACS